MSIGFSTGALAKGNFQSALGEMAASSADAVELSALRAAELPILADAFRDLDLDKFSYVSVHAPSVIDDEAETVRLLRTFTDAGINVVVHPDSIRDASLWRSLNGSVCIENMDSRKSLGRTVEELEAVFQELPEAKLCFDIGHARQVDPTMLEAVRILRRFASRVAQIHMSEVDTRGGHHAMTLGAIEAFRRVADLFPPDVPVILESTVESDGIDAEICSARDLTTSARRA